MRISCPLIPANLDLNDIEAFKCWLSTDPLDYHPKPFHNGLKLFLWIITTYFNLQRDIAKLE